MLASFFHNATAYLGALALLGVVLGILLALYRRKRLQISDQQHDRSLRTLTKVAGRMAQGDLDLRADVDTNQNQELKRLAAAMNAMAVAMQDAQKNLEIQLRESNAELARSEARHRTLFNASVNAVLLLAGQKFVECNAAAIAMFGAKARADLLNRHPSELSPPHQPNGEDSVAAANARIQTALDHGSHTFEWLHSRLDNGQSFDAEVVLNVLELDGKQFIQGTVKDISERKRIAAALHASEERHRTLVEWSPEGINVHRKGRLVYINAAAINMLGASSADQLLGKPIEEIIHPDFHYLLRQKVNGLSSAGIRDVSYEIKCVRLDGAVIDVAAQGMMIDFDGERSIYVAWQDITERKKNADLQRIAATVFDSQEGMFVTDAQWHILRTNQSFSAITGYDAEELIGSRPSFLGCDEEHTLMFSVINNSISERGSWQGEVVDQTKNAQAFPAWLHISSVNDEHGQITHYVGTFSDITLRKAAEDEIRHLAFYDPLTHLPNRRLLMDRLEQSLASGMRHQRKGALLFIDLDNFKTLNDTLGHDQGDLLLQQVAERLLLCTREGDTVARLGGDEFVVMLENLEEETIEASIQAETVASKILSELNQTYWLGVTEHHSSPSIGVTLFGEKHEVIAEPLKRADLAMYQAKAAGRNAIRFFDPKMQVMVSQRAELEEDLRDAMLNDQFQLYFQAQVDDEGRLFGAEVLIRWMHPKRGMISPAEFIPLAEETGLISIIGYWVLITASNQLAQWSTQKELAMLSIAVNVSPSQFHQKNFVEQVLDVVEMTGADPQLLKLELTEGFSISNIEDVIVKMTRLKARGVGFSLDDFGTGYSSLSYLKRLPLDQLKIDQSFVRDILVDPNDAAISKMVIVLAESLGLMVIAEGVETTEQKEFLATQGCRAYQGYLFSKPLPLNDFEAFARRAYQSPIQEITPIVAF